MPTKYDLVYLAPAKEDVEEIVKYHIAEVGPQAARNVYAAMTATIGQLRDFPLMGQIHPDPLLAAQGYRKLVLTRTYVAVYRLIDETVSIYRVVNGRTDYPKLLR